MEPIKSNPAQFGDEFEVDWAANDSRRARIFQEAFEASRAGIKTTLTDPLERHGIDTGAMPPEAMLNVAAKLLDMKPTLKFEILATVLILSIIAGIMIAVVAH